jgi:hypothetical protein
LALCSRFSWNGDVSQAHAISVLIALQFAYDIGLRHMEINVGCQEQLLGLINEGSPCYAPMGVLVDDICHWFSLFQF